MAPTTQPTHDPGLAQPPPNPSQVQASQPQAGVAPTIPAAPDLSNVHLSGLDQNQIMSLLRHLPNVFGKVSISFIYGLLVELYAFFGFHFLFFIYHFVGAGLLSHQCIN